MNRFEKIHLLPTPAVFQPGGSGGTSWGGATYNWEDSTWESMIW